mmetsp:Transcript_31907/g.49878  ORF Transcript_31907/g.49878 Transcript_31907/m.49878 type:complete len:83 (+) Transcript_31907:268-516(+)
MRGLQLFPTHLLFPHDLRVDLCHVLPGGNGLVVVWTEAADSGVSVENIKPKPTQTNLRFKGYCTERIRDNSGIGDWGKRIRI